MVKTLTHEYLDYLASQILYWDAIAKSATTQLEFGLDFELLKYRDKIVTKLTEMKLEHQSLKGYLGK